MTRALWDDFTTPGVSSAYNPPYDGTSQASQNGKFDATHCVIDGKGLLRLQMYEDNSGIANGFAGAGIQTAARYPVGTIFQFAVRSDHLSGATPIVLTMGDNWPPEIDIIEGPNCFLHWGQGNASRSQFSLPSGFDLTKWHKFKCEVTSTVIELWVDGVLYGQMAQPSPASDPYGLQYPMFLSLQYQTGDPGNPTDTTVTKSKPSEMQVDWIAIDVP
jgi:hypothetical protein